MVRCDQCDKGGSRPNDAPEKAVVFGADAPEASRASFSVTWSSRRRLVVAERKRDVDVALLERIPSQTQDELVALVGDLRHFGPRKPVQDLTPSENWGRSKVEEFPNLKR